MEDCTADDCSPFVVVKEAVDAGKSDDEGRDDDDNGVSCAIEEESAEVGVGDDDGIGIDDEMSEDVEGVEDDEVKLDETAVNVLEVVVAITTDPIEAAFVLLKWCENINKELLFIE